MKRKQDDNVITIKKDVRIPGTDYILEAGDKITVLNEAVPSVEEWEKAVNYINSMQLDFKRFRTSDDSGRPLKIKTLVAGKLSDLRKHASRHGLQIRLQNGDSYFFTVMDFRSFNYRTNTLYTIDGDWYQFIED